MAEAANQRAHRLVQRSQDILVVTHIAPDGDAIGSLLAMGRMLRLLGKHRSTLACDDGVPAKYDFLPGSAEVVRSAAGPFDLVIVVDCSDARRGGTAFQAAVAGGIPVINIDHHVTNTGFGQANLVQLDAVATTEVLYRLMGEWGLPIDADTALCLLTGLVTDTLCFRTANVTPTVMEVAAALMQAGADLAYVTGRTVNRRPFGDIRFLGTLLQTIDLEEGIVWVSASAGDRRAVGYLEEGDASVVSLLITAWEADMAASFVEQDDGRVEISFRAKPGFDVAGIAFQLGGGGHPAASGCAVAGPLDQVQERVLAMMRAARQEQVAASVSVGSRGT